MMTPILLKTWNTWKANWRLYLIEAWALGIFMVSAAFFVILFEHPGLPFRSHLPSPLLRRFLVGLAMGMTAIGLIYSPWGKRSGAHMNPAVTLTFLQLDRIGKADAAGYILAQFCGGLAGILVFKWTAYAYIAHPDVNYVATLPGSAGSGWAFGLETILSFTLFLTVLFSSNHPVIAPFTGYLVGILLVAFITLEAPFSGMSINPARTVASALPGKMWAGWWLYFAGPIAGMNAAGWLFRQRYRRRHGGNCLTMACHLSGERHDNPAYRIRANG